VEYLDKIEIPNIFHEWFMDKLKTRLEIEFEDRDKMVAKQQKEYNSCLKEIDGVTGMKDRNEIDEEDFQRKMGILKARKTQLQGLINDTNNQIDKDIETIEKSFTLAENAKKEFMTDDPDVQRRILSDLSSNLTLKDGKLNISLEKPLICIEKAAQEIKKIHKELEPLEMPLNTRKIEEIYSQNPILLRRQDSDPSRSRTYFCIKNLIILFYFL